jgi:WS/DGAT/MGAT family acyltransferase
VITPSPAEDQVMVSRTLGEATSVAAVPLSPLDSAFLRLEDRHTSLHIASIAIFDGPAPTYLEIAALFAAKVPLLPRYRQVVREAPLWLGPPAWVEYPDFHLSDHLRHTALPRPGGDSQLDELVGRLMSQQLDRSRPLWEAWLVEGLAGDRWAMINKVHHCMVDGIAGTDLLTTVFDPSSAPARTAPDDRTNAATPGRLAQLATAVTAAPRLTMAGVRQTAAGLGAPRATAAGAARRLHGLLGFAELARPAAGSSLSGQIGSARCWSRATVSLDDVRLVRRELGGTVNDIVLAAVTRGFRDHLVSRGETPTKHTLRTLVPVSVRADAQRGLADNRITAMVAELPVHLADPMQRLTAVRAELERLKNSGEPEAGVFLTEFAKYLPPFLVNAGLRVAFRVPQPFIVTVATNVPGPMKPLSAAGRQLRELYPYVPIADRLRIGVAISSYSGVLYFGVTADRDSIRNVAALTVGIEDGLAELVKLAKEVAQPA